MICTLQSFSAFPVEDVLPVCELDGKVQYVDVNNVQLSIFTNVCSNHPVINISRESIHVARQETHSSSTLFLPENNSLWKKLQVTWYEHGALDSLQILISAPECPPLLRNVTRKIVSFLMAANSIVPIIRKKENELSSLPKYTQTREWKTSLIRALAWHPHCTKIAVCSNDDSVRVFYANSSHTPVIKHQRQRNVTCLAWRPLSSSELAIGCSAGICLWTIDPMSTMTRPSSSCLVVLSNPNHVNVTSLSWHSEGKLLISGSAFDKIMYVWNVDSQEGVPLWRLGGGGVSLVSYSPSNDRVFAATTNIVFRIWNTEEWQCDRWSMSSGHVNNACWSPCGSVVLFTTTTEAAIYALTFSPHYSLFDTPSTEDKKSAVIVADLTPIELVSGERIGGDIIGMSWDPRGRHLAVSFASSDIIAVFITNISPKIHLSRCCLIKGYPSEIPSIISFQSNFADGANLTIGWSSGRVQYFPFVYVDIQSSSADRFANESKRNLTINKTPLRESQPRPSSSNHRHFSQSTSDIGLFSPSATGYEDSILFSPYRG
ncbi:unnamed protein product [Bemisia tabaci]|uniref:Aladin seven-bladed propeller domain-containing protein n=1 Tax=Bemisia tabaci TaxID=7038 RepID=A0A9P0F2Z9_BEMTA|nr:PREDICTED: aladin-like [Bemisia tabaci]XP_018903903.1 PREDICTED: aladin-like [Bemisia tabaci]XP_018903904.1 PREDICTED: aladin-like [Bemisia tabaci]CAH0389778.1 unnamed protein product [Bemisia tabaci]